METDHKAPPRQFVLLGSGPWLRPSPVVQRVCGFLCLGFVGVMAVIWILLEQQEYSSSHTAHTLALLLFVAGGLAFAILLGLGELWKQDSNRQYCPDCLQFMRRGARVCPYCGFQDEQAPAAVPAAPPVRRPRRSA